jgi:LAO/AO transport system kinase
MSLAERILTGETRAAARLMRNIDDNLPSARDELRTLFPHTGNAFLIGITGPPGAGKSTLVDQVTAIFRARGKRVGIVAVDPTSPFTGGAILGDRIRMNRHANDEGVFIRSLATRGYLGGLSRSTADVANVMDAMGMDVIIIETVGVGQDEVDIVRLAHTTLVVMVPGMGDDIQAIKAGILEIGDLFVVNKADRDGAERTERELMFMLEMNSYGEDAWRPPVMKTEAQRGTGVEELVDMVEAHHTWLRQSGEMDHLLRDKHATLFQMLLKDRLFAEVWGPLHRSGAFDELLTAIIARTSDPYSAVEGILAQRLRD